MALPKRAEAFEYYVELVSQADTKLFQVNPTLAAGDVQVSIDGGAFANLATLPSVSPASGRQVKVKLSAAEMTGDNIGVQFVDAAGAEWCDRYDDFSLGTRTAEDLTFLVTKRTGV